MALSETCYVFVRFFPGLREPFPFDRYVVLPDDQAEAVMEADAKQWTEDNEKRIEKWREERKTAIRSQAALRGGILKVKVQSPSPQPSPPSPTFFDIAHIAGWVSSLGHGPGFAGSIASPRFPVLVVCGETHAADLSGGLNLHFARDPLNPRFGWLPAGSLSNAEQRCVLTFLRKSERDTHGWGKILKPIMCDAATMAATVGTAQNEGTGAGPHGDRKPTPGGADGTPPAPGGATPTDDGTNRYAALEKMQPARRKAYLAFLYAEAKTGRRLEDLEAWDWLRENGTDEQNAGELVGYQLPEFANWARYVRDARKVTGEQKYQRRTARPTGKSIVHADEHEPQKPDDE